MSNQIDHAFAIMIATASTDAERETLRDAKLVAGIMQRIESPSDRRAIIAVLTEFDALAGLADAIAERRIIPFPLRPTSRSA
jgi:RNase P/RNase MRP subunit p30